MPGVVREELGAGDEIKVFKDEGEDEQEQEQAEDLGADLLEEKENLLQESEAFRKHLPPAAFGHPFGMGYLMNPYAAYANMLQRPPGHPSFPGLPPPLASPPPAHLGYPQGFRPPSYPGYPPMGLPPGMEQLAAWHRAPYPSPLATPPPPHPFLHPHLKQELGERPPHLLHPQDKENQERSKEPHIKKPLNAFMLYMKEMRPVVQAECTIKESAAINQILGRRWHGLSKEEQATYYERARVERQRHMELYPHWNARDSYRSKPKKRKREKTDDPGAGIKKCRARYSMDQQNLWCKPCRRKKKCVRVQMYLAGRSEQEIEATTFDQDGEPVEGELADSPDSPLSEHSEASPGPSYTTSGPDSVPSLTSPASPGPAFPSPYSPAASHANPPTPGSIWRPMGSDPRDTNNPLSISSMTSMVPSPSSYRGS